MLINDEFTDRVLEGEVSGAEALEFQSWLQAPANLERFALRAELHSDLRRSLRRRSIQSNANVCETVVEEATSPEPCYDGLVTSSTTGGFSLASPRMVIFAGVVVATACLVLAFLNVGNRRDLDSDQLQYATIVSEVTSRLTKNGSIWKGVGLSAGKYRLERGLLNLGLAGGVMVYVEAPTRFDIASEKKIILHSGRISANVPSDGTGFTIVTPEADVIDFGTEFSVDVGVGTSEVHVFDGLVRVQPKSRQGAKRQAAIDLRTSQAVKINDEAAEPVDIELATDRFIRTFDESRRRYSRTVKSLATVAFYRMAIRDQGLACQPPQYSGVVLMGDGRRPPHARGVFSGGSLRIQADSIGRGGRVDTPPPLRSGQLTLAAFVYLDATAKGAIVATNIHNDSGNFSLALNEQGYLQATIRNSDGHVRSIVSDTTVTLQSWLHVVMTADGEVLRLYEDGRQVASITCSSVADSETDVMWFGTDSGGQNLWDGRIDEVALFDRELSDAEVLDLYQAALEEIGKSE
ncbi:LamG-like jellyroll fold domain-containing protein [Stieleria varia]|uniref:FecR protein n=1 Tax=Stieleria varia TaxID=2528005 RepID=A0A5C6B0H1_9BACT|nr:LamG-like jellyroll fold domain-containing protein [Stieleria varia]TWU04786.1 FecR protein [Stieleria varia]